MGEGNQPNRRDPNRPPRRGAPFHGSSQGTRAEIEQAIVGEQLAVTEVKGLVIDEQSDELAIGYVNDCLTRLRGSILGLGLRQWTQFIETVEIRSRHSMRLAFVEIAARSDVAVGKCEQ